LQADSGCRIGGNFSFEGGKNFTILRGVMGPNFAKYLGEKKNTGLNYKQNIIIYMYSAVHRFSYVILALEKYILAKYLSIQKYSTCK
jgi:hypothetical protein